MTDLVLLTMILTEIGFVVGAHLGAFLTILNGEPGWGFVAAVMAWAIWARLIRAEYREVLRKDPE